MIEQGNARAQEQRFSHIVRDEHDGFPEPRRQSLKFLLQVRARDRIERAKRLVHQQDRRIRRERPRHAHALLLPARKLGWMASGELLGR